MGKKVIAAGHICLDITPGFPDRKVTDAAQIFQPGKLIEVGNADVHTGGSVANTGLAMKILGADVRLMGKIGNDAFGDMVMAILKKYDADRGMIRTDESGTSYSVVLAVPGIDRMFLHNPGANDIFHAGDVPQEALDDTALFHFGYPPLMASMYQNGGEELTALFKRVHDAGVATSLDLAAVDSSSEAGKQDWKGILERTLPYVDIFVPSIEELCFMLDRDRFDSWQKRAAGRDITTILDPETDIRPIADQCMNMGVKILMLKCGAPGMYCCCADEDTLSRIPSVLGIDAREWSGFTRFERSYVPDRILSGTGAGDTSIAAFLTAVLNGYSPEDCLHLAAAEGASCITEYDALSGIRPLDELKERIDSGWKKA
ncbi:MAG: carbohydrate kinase family protein [Lachnospiraceae bacterium]|uniref:Carbohydrate kinase family protein n=1 Tax=Candidatus Weimeria bifida TaxID=2599074 RepID=A0A6N7J0Q8_9FIRM|nr:carbohydrate kinase family protein [Candidatus Weimeria bifida]RRF97068.1 MAG: carbohydrate kinase family protein [Lachnospiraceae bacterium]